MIPPLVGKYHSHESTHFANLNNGTIADQRWKIPSLTRVTFCTSIVAICLDHYLNLF